jgi:transcriptional regulator with XRE-family HTH domain
VNADRQFGIGFKRAREGRGLTQEHVVTEMNRRGFAFHQSSVYKLENDLRRVSIAEALALADIVQTPVEMLALLPDARVPEHEAAALGWARRVVDAIRASRERALTVVGEAGQLGEALFAYERAGGSGELRHGLELLTNIGQLSYDHVIELERALWGLPDELLQALRINRSDLPGAE